MNTEDTFKEAIERFSQAEAAQSQWSQQATEDLKFCADDQWDQLARQNRESTGRPCFTADHISPAIRQIVNESRQNRPAIEVDPKGSGAEVETAKIYAGLIRDIEYQSNADTAYDTAEEYAVKIGLGYFRLTPEYDDPDSFDQVLRIKTVDDPLTVYLDPDHREPDGSDAEWGFIVKELNKDQYCAQYPKTGLAKITQWRGRDLNRNGWVKKDSVRVAEYFHKTYTPHTIYHVAIFATTGDGGMTFMTEQVTDEKPDDDDIEAKRVVILNTRTSEKVTVKWDILNGHEVIKSTDFAGSYIPIFPVKGEEMRVEGRRVIMGAVRRAKDTQKIINYMISNQVEAIDLANKVPYVGAAGQFDTFEDRWATANQRAYAYLEYNTVDVNGSPAPAPQRQAVDTPISASATTRAQSVDDLKAIFGIYEAAAGANGNETSGVAIIARKEQSSNSNFHYYDNLVRAIKHLGKVLVEVIPTYYDTARTVRIVKANGEQELVAINTYDENKQSKVSLDAGKYDVIVKTGPTYQTKRQKMVENSNALISQYPAAGPLIADLVVGASDFEGSQEIAARLRTQVPPEVLAATGEDGSKTGDPKALIAQLQAQAAQSKKNLEALNAHCAEVEQLLKYEKEETKLLKQKEAINVLKAEGDYNIKSRQLELQEQTTELEFLVKQEELQQNRERLEIEKNKLGISATVAASKLAGEQLTTELSLLDRQKLEKSEGPADLTVGGTDPDFNATGMDSDLGGKIGVDTI